MLSYDRKGRTYYFDPLPVCREAATFTLAMTALMKQFKAGKKAAAVDPEAIGQLIGVLPEVIELSMSQHQTPDAIQEFMRSIVLNFGDPDVAEDAFKTIGDLNALFMGINPDATAQP